MALKYDKNMLIILSKANKKGNVTKGLRAISVDATKKAKTGSYITKVTGALRRSSKWTKINNTRFLVGSYIFYANINWWQAKNPSKRRWFYNLFDKNMELYLQKIRDQYFK